MTIRKFMFHTTEQKQTNKHNIHVQVHTATATTTRMRMLNNQLNCEDCVQCFLKQYLILVWRDLPGEDSL